MNIKINKDNIREEDCSSCHGTGMIQCNDGVETWENECYECDGSGKIKVGIHQFCSICLQELVCEKIEGHRIYRCPNKCLN